MSPLLESNQTAVMAKARDGRSCAAHCLASKWTITFSLGSSFFGPSSSGVVAERARMSRPTTSLLQRTFSQVWNEAAMMSRSWASEMPGNRRWLKAYVRSGVDQASGSPSSVHCSGHELAGGSSVWV